MSVSRFYVHTVTVEQFLGVNGNGVDLFSPAVTLAPPNGVYLDDSRKMVRSSKGEIVVSESTLFTTTANAPLFTPDARVTAGGNISRVIKTNVNDSGGLKLPDHCAVTLT